MSTQYDKIGASYAVMKKLPGARLEEANMEAALKPLVQDTKVLDLACGMGRYSRPLVSEWGAKYVLGVDISSAMVEEARKITSQDEKYHGKLDFEVGDCSKSSQYLQGPFDVVLGSWLFNYAPDLATQVDMWKNALTNLSPTGRVVALTPTATEDPEQQTLRAQNERPFQKGEIFVDVVERVEDGVKTRLTAVVEPQIVQFEAYHLKKSVYERAARIAGFKGTIEWRNGHIPEHKMDDPLVPEWQSFLREPHFSILVVAKT